MQKNSFLVALIVAVVASVAGYQMVIAKPADNTKDDKVAGEVYVLPKEFLINLVDGRFARLDVALEFDHGYSSVKAAEKYAEAHGGGDHAAAPVEGFGVLPQEPVIRDLITDALTDSTARQMQDGTSRERLKKSLMRKINRETDVPVHAVLFTDVAVQ